MLFTQLLEQYAVTLFDYNLCPNGTSPLLSCFWQVRPIATAGGGRVSFTCGGNKGSLGSLMTGAGFVVLICFRERRRARASRGLQGWWWGGSGARGVRGQLSWVQLSRQLRLLRGVGLGQSLDLTTESCVSWPDGVRDREASGCWRLLPVTGKEYQQSVFYFFAL